MRSILILGVFLAALSSLRAADAAAPAGGEPVVLITAYKPFAQRAVNGSQTVAEALQRAGVTGVKLQVLLLDVQWPEPAAKLPALVEQLRPRLLIGLGEGFPGRVAIERIARNQREGRDTSGALPRGVQVEADGPAQRRGTLLFDPEWKLSQQIPVVASDDAGTYLCNALLYTALGLNVPRVGFVHLPPQGTDNADEYSKRFVPIIRELITRNL